jgi:nicotinamidase-related amidase
MHCNEAAAMIMPWDGVVPERDQEIYRNAGFGRPAPWGARPALLVIDIQYRSVGTARLPIEQSMQEFATSCGEAGWQAIDTLLPVLDKFRSADWPVIYPFVAPKEPFDGGRLAQKVPAIMSIPRHGYDLVKEIAPRPHDVVIPKRHSSAFFGTPLLSYLLDRRVDTLVLAGTTTSGCIRCAAVDAFSYNFNVFVPHDCVFDRSPFSHAVGLYEMSQKYANVVGAADILSRD